MDIKEFQCNGFGNGDLTGLYVIAERTSKTMTAGPIPAATDLVALFGFIQWLKTHEQNSEIKTADKMYSLARVGIMARTGQIVNTEGFRLCTGDEAKAMYDHYVEQALEEEENNDD